MPRIATQRRRQLKFTALGIAVAACLAAGSVYAHGDAHAPNKNAETKQTAFGRSGDPKKVSRTVKVDMSDTMRFTPAALSVHAGETIRFVVKNSGAQLHEMVIGSAEELKEHAALMKKFPGMEHDEPYMAHVSPGKSETIVWQFNKPGEFLYGCLIPGHFEAGMVGRITVARKGKGESR